MEKYTIMLTKEEVDKLNEITSKGTIKAKIAKQARALLLLDKGEFTEGSSTIHETAKATGLSVRSINNLKKALAEKDLESIINPPPYGKSKRPIKFDGEIQAKVTQLACETAPDGRKCWTLYAKRKVMPICSPRIRNSKAMEISITNRNLFIWPTRGAY